MTKGFQDEFINMMKISSHTNLKKGFLHNEDNNLNMK